MMAAVIESRLTEIAGRPLGHGKHEALADGMCVMEAVSYVAGEPWSDAPSCACPVITAFLVLWNDALPDDATRDRLLKPLVPLIVNSRNPFAEERRSFLALDWLIRVHTPKWLDLVPSLAEHAAALRDLVEVADMAGAVAAGLKVRPAGAAAGDAARAAARDAAGDAAGDAAWAAARAAARDAARAAARDAAGDALRPTTEWLQTSAVALVHRMLEVR